MFTKMTNNLFLFPRSLRSFPLSFTQISHFSTFFPICSVFDSNNILSSLYNIDVNSKEDFVYMKNLKLDKNISLQGKKFKNYYNLGPADAPTFKSNTIKFLSSLQDFQLYAVFFRVPSTDGGFITTHKQIVLNKNIDPDIIVSRVVNSLNYWESFYEVSTASTILAEYFPFHAGLDKPDNKIDNIPKTVDNHLGFNPKFLKNKNIPFSMDLSKYGILINSVPASGKISDVNKKDFPTLRMKVDRENKRHYSTIINTVSDVLTIKTYLNKDTKFIIEEIDSNTLNVKVYDKTNLKVLEYTDENFGNYFIRNMGDLYLKIDHQENILYSEKTYKNDFVKKTKRELVLKNKIITFDIEAFLHPLPKEIHERLSMNKKNDKNLKMFVPFACGFYDGSVSYKFYLSDFEDYKDMLKACIFKMADPKYKDYTIYVHNGGGFDFIYLLDVIKTFNSEELIGKPKITGKDSRVIGFDIKIYNSMYQINSKKSNIPTLRFRDSYKLLSHSLRKLTKEFKVEDVKGNFPYTFPNASNLNYIGDKPDFKYYESKVLIELKYEELLNDYKNNILFNFNLIKENDKNKINFEDLTEFKPKAFPKLQCFDSNKLAVLSYNDITKDNWDLKEECFKYLDSDLIGLHQVLIIFSEFIYKKYRLNITKVFSISSLSMKIFTSNYLKSENTIPIISNRKVHKDIRNALYGGRVEVFNPILSIKSYLNDVNSIYPWAMLKPMPVGYPTFSSNTDLNKLFGIVYATVFISEYADPVLPKRTKEGQLIFPKGTWTAWFFSEELKNAQFFGVKVTVHHSYLFEKSTDLFKNFIEDLFELKRTSSDSKRAIYKLIMNSSYGRWALKFYKTVINVVDKKTAEHLILTHNVEEYIEFGEENKIYVRHSVLPDFEDCIDNNIDYNMELIKSANSQYDSISSIPIGIAITSWARVLMTSKLFDPFNPCAYSDTDCGVFSKELPGNIVNDLLGGWKLEHVVNKGLFPLDKVYTLDTLKGVISKNKGISGKLSTLDFIDLYKGKCIDLTEKRWVKDLSLGIIYVSNVDIHLNNVYFKRKKIIHKGFWIGTEPLTVFNDGIINKPVLANFSWENFLFITEYKLYNMIYTNYLNNSSNLSHKFKEIKELNHRKIIL